MNFTVNEETAIHKIKDPKFDEFNIELYLKREDQIHPEISGNKWRKLKYNIQEAKRQNKKVLLTFGGAFSNHIAAVAAAGREFEFETIGVIRGEEHMPLNPTLKSAVSNGMKLTYLERSTYRKKYQAEVQNDLKNQFGDCYIIPEGGSNALAVKGCMEILNPETTAFDVICCPVGTGGTLAGLSLSLAEHQHLIGFSVLKGGDFLLKDIEQLQSEFISMDSKMKVSTNWSLNLDYHLGGYAKVNEDLIQFMYSFYDRHRIILDAIYTAKMMWGIQDLLRKGMFKKGSKILAIHTGGLQGNAGFNIQIGSD